MKEANESPYWYRVAGIRPELREHAKIHRHRYRGEIWYVLEDPTAQRFHRFTPAIYEILQLFDGQNNLEDIFILAGDLVGEEAPSQQELINVLAQLHSADALETQVEADTDYLLERLAKMKKQKFVGQLVNPLFLKIPLLDPERLTVWGMRFLKPLFSKAGFIAWAAFCSIGLFLTVLNWTELSADVLDRVLAEENLLILWLVFPVVKGLHEMGHAFMTKAFGGESHEMGVMLLLLMPLPYVDASSASRFKLRRQRVLVGCAGMMVEMVLGTVALVAWVYLDPGLLRSIAYNVFFTAGVSTVVFNINPLLRYDGYYILADLIEIPNLRAKSMNFLLYLLERYAYKVPGKESPASDASERNWLAVYAPCSFAYRLTVVGGIIWAIATKFFFIGTLVAISTSVAWIGLPLWKAWKYLKTNGRLRPVRARAFAVTSCFIGSLVFVPLLVPIPLNSIAEGVVWLPEESVVRAEVDGWVREEFVENGQWLEKGQAVVRLEDSNLATQLLVSEAKGEELQAMLQTYRPEDIVSMEVVREELMVNQALLAELKRDQEQLVVRPLADGFFHYISGPEQAESFVRRGQLVGTVMTDSGWNVLVMLRQDEVDLIRSMNGRIGVRFADEIETVYEAVVVRETPTGSKDLPSGAFSSIGGGRIALDPTAEGAPTAFERWFRVELNVPLREGEVRPGGRAYVRFSHGFEPLGKRWSRGLRRLFLSEFGL